MNRCLFLVIEGNKGNKGDIANKYETGEISLPYEEEAINCVAAWRERGGKFQDIPIYMICVNNNPPSRKTVAILRNDYNVYYQYAYHAETDDYICGYWNVPLAGKYLENIIKEDIIIHIDLDMTLLNEPSKQLLTLDPECYAKLGVNEFPPTDRYPDIEPRYPKEANTGFIVSWRNAGFYEMWYGALKYKSKNLDPNDPAYSIWEERIIDIMHYENGLPIEWIEHYQINGDVTNYTDEEIKNLKFFHGHHNMPERNEKYMKKYVSRLLDL